MADSILKLKVESTEYDAKLKRATDGLNRYVDGCRKVGGTLEVVEKDTLDYVRAIGRMDTTSRTATGKLSEMKKAFVELSAQYKNMTDAEKASPMGKALDASLDQLKGRISESKTQIDDINKSMNGSSGLSGALDSIAGKFGLNIDQLTRFGGVLGAASAAAKVAKDAFYANEAAVDEWGRTVEATQSAYAGFLNAINNGDISGYLSRIHEIVTAARQAYDEIDRLGTMKTIQSPKISAQQTENERLRMMIQTRRYIAPVDGRRAAMTNGQLLTDAQVKTLERQLQNGIKSISTLVGNEVRQASKAIEAEYRKQALESGISLSDFKRGTSSMAEFDRRIQGARMYEDFEQKRKALIYNSETGQYDQPNLNKTNPYEAFRGWDVFRVDGEPYNKLVQMIRDRDQQASQAYSMQSQAYRAINRAEGISVRGTSGGRGGGKTTVATDADIEAKIEANIMAAWQKVLDKSMASADNLKATGEAVPSEAWKAVSQSMASEFEQPLSPLEKLNAQLKELKENLEKAPDTASYKLGLQAIADTEKQIAEFTGQGQQNPAKVADETAKSWQTAASAISQAGSAMQSIEDPSAKVAGMVMQAIATIATAYAQALETDWSSKTSVWTFIAAAAAATTSMLATISAIHSATGFAEGGVVRGSTYSNDQIPAMLNAGEVVLNRAQQGNLASQLQDGGGSNPRPSYISGEQIYLAMNRYMQRTGRGELATWK